MNIFLIFIMIFSLFSCLNANNPTNTETTSTKEISQKIYLDVRTMEEWNAGHVEGAIHIPLSDIQNGKNLDKIPKDTPVHVYCRSGNRSGQAVKILEEKGFTNLVNAGGMTSLQNVNIVK